MQASRLRDFNLVLAAVLLIFWTTPSIDAAKRQQSSESKSSLPALSGKERQRIASELLGEAFDIWKADPDRNSERGTLLIKNMAVCCDAAAVQRALNENVVKAAGIHFDTVGVTSFSIRQRMIQVHLHLGNIEQAIRLAEPLPTNSEQLEKVLENKYLLTKGFCRRGDLDRAIQIAKSIPKTMAVPNGQSISGSYRRLLSFLAIMEAYCDRGKYDEAVLVADRNAESIYEASSWITKLFEQKTFREGPVAGMEFLKWNFEPGLWSYQAHSIVDRLLKKKKYEDAANLTFLISGHEKEPDLQLRNLLRSLLLGRQTDLAARCIAELELQIANTREAAGKDKKAYYLAEVLSNSGQHESALRLIKGRGDGGKVEQVFLKTFHRTFRSAVLGQQMSPQQGIPFANALRTNKQKTDLLNELVRALKISGQHDTARQVIRNHLTAEQCDRFSYATLMLGEEELDGFIADTELLVSRNQLRFQRARLLIFDGKLAAAQKIIDNLESPADLDWTYEGLTNTAVECGHNEFAIRLVLENSGAATQGRINRLASRLIVRDRVDEAIDLIEVADQLVPEWQDVGGLWSLSQYPGFPRKKLIATMESLGQARGEFAQHDRFLAYLYAMQGNQDKAVLHCRAAIGKKETEHSLKYQQLHPPRFLKHAFQSSSESQIRIAIQLESTDFDTLLENNSEVAKAKIESIAGLIRQSDDLDFKTLALQRLAEKVRPKLAIFHHYYNH